MDNLTLVVVVVGAIEYTLGLGLLRAASAGYFVKAYVNIEVFIALRRKTECLVSGDYSAFLC